MDLHPRDAPARLMRISEEKQASTVRVTKLEVVIYEALREVVPEDHGNALLDLEVLEALAKVSARLTGDLRRANIEEKT